MNVRMSQVAVNEDGLLKCSFSAKQNQSCFERNESVISCLLARVSSASNNLSGNVANSIAED